MKLIIMIMIFIICVYTRTICKDYFRKGFFCENKTNNTNELKFKK